MQTQTSKFTIRSRQTSSGCLRDVTVFDVLGLDFEVIASGLDFGCANDLCRRENRRLEWNTVSGAADAARAKYDEARQNGTDEEFYAAMTDLNAAEARVNRILAE